MKWPSSLTIIRHGQSEYNILRNRKQTDPDYQEFVRSFNHNHLSAKTKELAELLLGRYDSKTSDADTMLTSEGNAQAFELGKKILSRVQKPDVIFASPYKRTRRTLTRIIDGAKIDIRSFKYVIDDRIREQEHGLSILYGDWRIFQTMHPEQKLLRDRQGEYWYQYPQGESVSMVRERVRSFQNMLVREYAGANVWIVSHHLTKLAIRANLERLSPEEFVRIDKEEKPINCGVTTYRGVPEAGKDGRLELEHYNLKLY